MTYLRDGRVPAKNSPLSVGTRRQWMRFHISATEHPPTGASPPKMTLNKLCKSSSYVFKGHSIRLSLPCSLPHANGFIYKLATHGKGGQPRVLLFLVITSWSNLHSMAIKIWLLHHRHHATSEFYPRDMNQIL